MHDEQSPAHDLAPAHRRMAAAKVNGQDSLLPFHHTP